MQQASRCWDLFMTTASRLELTKVLLAAGDGRIGLERSTPRDVADVFGPADVADDSLVPYSAWHMVYDHVEFFFNDARRLKAITISRPSVGIAIPGQAATDMTLSPSAGDVELVLFGNRIGDIARVTAGLAALPSDFAGRVGGDPQGKSIFVMMQDHHRRLSVNYVLASRQLGDGTFDIDYHLEGIRLDVYGPTLRASSP
jgi:hypothetical protein